MKSKAPAQILVTTLVVLLLVSLTVVVITATLARNSRQVFNNREYERSYNLAETRVISAAETLADPNFDLNTLPALGIDGASCEIVSGREYLCTFNETSSKTFIKIVETNVVEDFDLGREEYFDIILKDNVSFTGTINLKWVGETALDLALIYKSQGKLYSSHKIIDPTQNSSEPVYASIGGSSAGFTNSITNSDNNISINLGNLNSTEVPANAELLKLRIKAVNKLVGTSITIRPQDVASNLPDQVRKLTAYNYEDNTLETAAPVVTTQLPLSPPLPDPLTFSANLHSVNQPQCGDGIKEGNEVCDDANTVNTDQCPSNCRCPVNFKSFTWSPHEEFLEAGDGEMVTSNPFKLCASVTDRFIRFPSGELDDILVLIRADQNVQRYGDKFVFPTAHIMFTPNFGSINGIQKQFTIGSSNNTNNLLECGDPPCDIGSFSGRGYNVYDFGDRTTIQRMRQLGLIQGDEFITSLKMVHIGAGAGHAINIKIISSEN